MIIVLSRREMRTLLCGHHESFMVSASLQMTQDSDSGNMGLSVAVFAAIPVPPRKR